MSGQKNKHFDPSLKSLELGVTYDAQIEFILQILFFISFIVIIIVVVVVAIVIIIQLYIVVIIIMDVFAIQ